MGDLFSVFVLDGDEVEEGGCGIAPGSRLPDLVDIRRWVNIVGTIER